MGRDKPGIYQGGMAGGKRGMMPDREKYIEVLSKTVKTVKEFNEDAPIKISLNCIEDILELLKRQEEQKFFVDESGKITPLPVVVRCKDCIHWDKHTEECGNPDSVCFHNGWCKPDWFCADGERK